MSVKPEPARGIDMAGYGRQDGIWAPDSPARIVTGAVAHARRRLPEGRPDHSSRSARSIRYTPISESACESRPSLSAGPCVLFEQSFTLHTHPQNHTCGSQTEGAVTSMPEELWVGDGTALSVGRRSQPERQNRRGVLRPPMQSIIAYRHSYRWDHTEAVARRAAKWYVEA